jgi:hypothetical protein
MNTFKTITKRANFGIRQFSDIIPKIKDAPKSGFGLMQQGTIISKLENRSMISVRGPDATSFL